MIEREHALSLAAQMEQADELVLSRSDLDLAAKALRKMAGKERAVSAARIIEGTRAKITRDLKIKDQ